MEDQKSSNHSKEANQQIHVLNIEKRVSQQNQKEIFNPHRHSTNRKPTKKIKNKNNSLWFSLTNTPLNKQIKYLFAMTIASVIVAIGYVCFFTPNQFLSGGSWGMAAIIQHYLPSMPFGISLFLVNSPLLIIGWKKLNTRFCIYTLYCMILQSALLVAFEPFLPGYTNEPLLASIFGGVLIGVGSGIIVRYHGSSGGLDIVGLLIKEKIDISIGTVILGFNLLIVGIAAWIFGLERAMYTIVGIYITTSVFNTVLEGFNSKRNVMIITDRGNAIADNLMKGIKRGVTILPAVGGYSQEEKDVVFCVVSRFELAPLKEIVQDTDPDAFVCINEVYEVMGKFARKAPRNNPNGANSR